MAKSDKDDDIKKCDCGCGAKGNRDERAEWIRVYQRRIGGGGFSLAVFGKLRFSTLECFHSWTFRSRKLQRDFLEKPETDKQDRQQLLRELRAIGWQYHPPRKG